MKYAELTNYDKIYKDVYWGAFTVSSSLDLPKISIIHARNWFIQKYKIISVKDCPTKLINMRRELNLDHTECYEDAHGRLIYLYSMYDKHQVPHFTTINSMYSSNQRTAIQIFETTKSKNKMIKNIKSRLPDELNKIIKDYLDHKDVWYNLFSKK